MLVLAHREVLVDQALKAFGVVHPGASRGKVRGAVCEYHRDITAAMVPTLGREDKAHPQGQCWKLRRLLSDGPFDLVIVDEGHHSPSATYLRVLEAVQDPGTLRLGVTATPNRSDGLALAEVYDEIVYQYALVQAIEDGYLVRPRGVRHRLSQVDLDKAEVSRATRDFSEVSLAKLFDTPHGRAESISAWERHAAGVDGSPRRTILFACTVAHAEHLCQDLRARGYRSAAISQHTADEDRLRYFRQLATGELDVLASVMVLTEGFDEPSVGCVFMVRPTQSWSLYVQMLGRGLRLHTSKKECLVVDVSGNTSKFSLVGLNMLGGFQLEEEEGGSDGELRARPNDLDKGQFPRPEQGVLPVEVGEGVDVDLVAVKCAGRYDWQRTRHGDALLCGAPDRGGIFLVRRHDPGRDGLPKYCADLCKVVYLQAFGPDWQTVGWRAEVAGQKLSPEEARALVEQEAPRLGAKRSAGGIDESGIGTPLEDMVEWAVGELANRNKQLNQRLSRPLRDAAVGASDNQRRRLRDNLGFGAAATDGRITKGAAQCIIAWAAVVGEQKARRGIESLQSAQSLSDRELADLVERGELVRAVTLGWKYGFDQRRGAA